MLSWSTLSKKLTHKSPTALLPVGLINPWHTPAQLSCKVRLLASLQKSEPYYILPEETSNTKSLSPTAL